VGLTQFFVDGDGYTPRTSTVSLADRPPMNALRPPRDRRGDRKRGEAGRSGSPRN
jgi:hypothetical protein